MSRKSTPGSTIHRDLGPTARAAAFRRGLLRWFRRHGRDLPWRRTRDPYRIVVSEFMLQQTQVSRVEGYFDRFLEQYPTVHALAAASPLAVRESWEGLGYYRRAANLHRLAQAVVGEHGGVVPSDPMVLRGLPGVGRYTAGAVASFAYERRTPAVDTNVARVLRRAFHPRLGSKARQPRSRGRSRIASTTPIMENPLKISGSRPSVSSAARPSIKNMKRSGGSPGANTS